MSTKPVTFDTDGYINDGPYVSLYVLPLAICMRDSAWDFPSFIFSLGLQHLWADDRPEYDCEPPMHPDQTDAIKLADCTAFDTPADRNKFINDFPLEWDT